MEGKVKHVLFLVSEYYIHISLVKGFRLPYQIYLTFTNSVFCSLNVPF